jgi:NADPH:quinone reductase-like Zn-dependent oxidoreductase
MRPADFPINYGARLPDRHPFADAANAYEYLESNEQFGKVVIQVS